MPEQTPNTKVIRVGIHAEIVGEGSEERKRDLVRELCNLFDEWAIKSREKFAKADADRSSTLNRAEFATTAVVRRVKPRPDCPPGPSVTLSH